MRAKLVNENISFHRAESDDSIKKKLFSKTLKAVERAISSVWTIEYRLLGDNKVEILSYGRDDPEGYEREGELPKGKMIEDKKRNAVSLMVWNPDSSNLLGIDTYTIANPKHVFSYSY